MSRRLQLAVFLVLGCLFIPGIAAAQSAIAGVVRDSSGAVLPGVTVEASSPALIEKTRSTVTDAAGKAMYQHVMDSKQRTIENDLRRQQRTQAAA